MDGIIGEKSNINSNSLFSDAGEDFYRQFSTALSSAERVVVDMTSVREKRRNDASRGFGEKIGRFDSGEKQGMDPSSVLRFYKLMG